MPFERQGPLGARARLHERIQPACVVGQYVPDVTFTTGGLREQTRGNAMSAVLRVGNQID